MKKRKLTTADKIAVKCPYCGRKPRQACVTRRLAVLYNPALFVHRQRVRLAEARMEWKGRPA